MLAHPIATAALLIMGQSAASAATLKNKHPNAIKTEFMRAMTSRSTVRRRKQQQRKLSYKDFQAELYGTSKKSAALRKKIIEKSTVIKSPGGGQHRKLEDANYANNENYYQDEDGNWVFNQNNYNNDNWQQDAQANYEYQVNNQQNQEKNYKYDANQDGSDDYFQAYGDWENNFGFDVTQFSLSYHRCASVRQYDDEIAAQEDTPSVFATKRFAVFRFCPEQTCMGFQEDDGYGIECDEDTYGEDYCEYLEQYAEWVNEYGGQDQNGNNYQYQQAEGEEGEEGQQQFAYRNAEYRNGKWYGPNGGVCEDFDNNGDCVEEVMFGARGQGCQNNYGEYMMEVDTYLQLMLEWQEERFQTYCEYCEECMFRVYETWLQNGGQNRKLSFEQFKHSKEHDEIRELAGEDEHRKLGNYYNVCPEYDTCAEYQGYCQGGMEEGYSEYFECTEIERNNGQVAYIGPHCAEDGFTITLGIFSDEYCNEYIGNGVSISNFLGEEWDYEEDELKAFYNSAHGATLDQLEFINEENVCIPCNKADLMWEEEGNTDDDQAQYNKNSEINELCENLYLVSSRCDKHYRSYNTRSKQAKFAEAVAQEDLSCDFIDSVVVGNYDELGYVNMGKTYTVEAQPGWMADSMYAQQYGHYITEVTPLQIFGLIASIAVCGILAVWSMTLHKSLTKTGPWKPRRGFAAARGASSPTDAELSRQNSGIVMGRSASNTSYYMS